MMKKNARASITTQGLRRCGACLIIVALAFPVLAQNSTPAQGNNQSRGAGNSDALTLLLEQNQQLRTELQALRAMIEEQGFELRRLQRDSLNRYTNMDNRLSALESSAVAVPGSAVSGDPASAASAGNRRPGISASPNSTAAGNSGNNARAPLDTGANANASTNANTAPTRSSRATSRSTLQPAVLSEQQLYQMAYESVINSNFERSISEFDQYLSVYPEGRFVTNAHYWKGQAYLYLNRYAEARSSYEIIVDNYADSAKLPDAMYGLALSHQGLGNIPQARQLLNDIKRRFPNTGVANLADTRLLTLD